MIDLSIADVVTRFPDFRVAVLHFEGNGIPAERTPRIETYIAESVQTCRARWSGTELSAIPGVAAWRRAYKGFGIKSTSYRSSVERLVKRVLAGDDIPRINAFVDLYNAVSLAHVLCLGADDLDRIDGDLAFRFAREGDSFIDMAPAEGLPAEQPPKSGEVVYAAGSTVLCRRWNWRQDARSVVGPQTRRIVLTIQSNGEGSIETAAETLNALAASELAMTCTVAFADSARPHVQMT
ncbi:phenylalanine--tRNA ligase beta subunit-related protein [Roseiarcaceae bacterium H3SJ34-1]|uniref:B3/B4 domain-containing protein n=1 Tax=Terripilifer ovatus TaxID=3032367 RepID=UPI003AB93B7A|nr:phenylalanine--tRNA ligase beta subunit-related protein [Roseiarcaceae bacterium H3SJ34-1]